MGTELREDRIKSFGRHLAAIRKAKGFTQEELVLNKVLYPDEFLKTIKQLIPDDSSKYTRMSSIKKWVESLDFESSGESKLNRELKFRVNRVYQEALKRLK